jgi:hypothetical protein
VVVVVAAPAAPGPADVVVAVEVEITVTETVFCKESALLGAIVRVTVPLEAEDDAKIEHDIPALCPPDIADGEQPEDMLKLEGDTVILPN